MVYDDLPRGLLDLERAKGLVEKGKVSLFRRPNRFSKKTVTLFFFFWSLMAEPRVSPSSPSMRASAEDGDSSLRIKWQKYFGRSFSVFEVNGEKYLLGVQMASLLRRETYNVYRSLKIKKIALQRATAAEVSTFQ